MFIKSMKTFFLMSEVYFNISKETATCVTTACGRVISKRGVFLDMISNCKK